MIDITPTVSIILITYNRQTLLMETIQSILNQTYSDFELIVVDNYSNYDFFRSLNLLIQTRLEPIRTRIMVQ